MIGLYIKLMDGDIQKLRDAYKSNKEVRLTSSAGTLTAFIAGQKVIFSKSGFELGSCRLPEIKPDVYILVR